MMIQRSLTQTHIGRVKKSKGGGNDQFTIRWEEATKYTNKETKESDKRACECMRVEAAKRLKVVPGSKNTFIFLSMFIFLLSFPHSQRLMRRTVFNRSMLFSVVTSSLSLQLVSL